MHGTEDVIVVGGGVVGLACALALAEDGRSVRVLERDRVGCGSSHGNCGTLTPSHAAPLAAPGTVRKALRWMLTPDAPFYLKPRVDPALWRWLLRFAARCDREQWLATMRHKGALLQASRELFPGWIARFGLDCEFVESGFDYVFRSQAALDAVAATLEPLRALGIASQVIGGDDYLRQEPAVREGVAGAVRFPGDAHLRPDRYVAEMARAARGRGVRIEEGCAVRGIAVQREGVVLASDRGEFAGRDVVLAAGAWTPLLARSAGLHTRALAPSVLQPGKGYSITYDPVAAPPKRPLVLYERSVCVTSWASGFRLGSTMEFSGYDTRRNRRRLDALERGAAEYLHEPVGPVKREEWFGWRPLTFDDLPMIGRVPGHRHVWIAAGHGMMGVGMSTGTAQLLSEMIAGRETSFDATPYRPGRFL